MPLFSKGGVNTARRDDFQIDRGGFLWGMAEAFLPDKHRW